MNSRTFIFFGLLFAVVVAVSLELVAPEASKDDNQMNAVDETVSISTGGSGRKGGGGKGGGKGGGRGGGGGGLVEEDVAETEMVEEINGHGRGGGGYGGGGHRGGGGRGGGGGGRGGGGHRGGGGRGGGGGGRGGGGGGLQGEQGEVTIDVMEDAGVNGGGGYGGGCKYRCCRYRRCYCCAPNAAGDMVEITQN